MNLAFANPLALWLWPPLAALVAWQAWRRRRPQGRHLQGGHPQGMPLRIVVMRLALVTLLVLAFANPGGESAANTERLVVLVDQSASVGGAARGLIAREARFSAPQITIAPFAEKAHVNTETVIGNGTDIELALDFANRLLTGARGRVLLLSDGAQTAGDALRAAHALAASQIAVDVLLVETSRQNISDVAVEAVRMPEAAWAGDIIPVTVNLYSVSATTAKVSLIWDEQRIAEREIDLPAGETRFDFAIPADAPGLSVIRVEVNAQGDSQAVNDAAEAIIAIRPTPEALIAAHHMGAGQHLRDVLAQGGMAATTVEASQVPSALTELLRYQVLALEDVSAEALSLEQWAAVRAFTQTHGRGLVVLGGRSAYTLGAYETTPLEAMLPVKLEPPRRTERPPVALLLVIDNSGSMGPGQDFGAPKIDLAKEAAMRAVEILQPNDRVGVIGFNDTHRWFAPLETLGRGLTRRDVLDRINTMTARGGTNMLTPLQAGVRELAAQPTERRHLILLSDGETYRGNASDFERIVREAEAAGVTVSTIALNASNQAWQGLMASIAEWGKGRYHFAADPADIPNLLLAESEAVNSDPIQRGRTQALVSNHPMVRSLSGDDIPPVEGYIALTPRPEAEMALTSGSFGDPLLAAWQYGLGRVVAWTSDVSGDWTRTWENWEEAPRFWSQVVRYALPDPAQQPLFASVTVQGRDVQVRVIAHGEDGKGINLAEGQLLFRAPDGAVARVVLPQTAPGEYTVTFAAPLVGAYRALLTLEKGEEAWETPVGFVIPYAPEYNPRFAPDAQVLEQIAEVTGGKVIGSLNEVRLPRVVNVGVQGYAPWLILAALILWPIEIAARRKWMPWEA